MENIRSLLPQSKHDIERAEAVIKTGYPAIKPILPELLEWMQDVNYPVAQVLAPFLASIGTPLVPYIEKIFATDDHVWKLWIMSYIISESEELAIAFRDELERLAYFPTKTEIEEELNEDAQLVLKEFGWLDPSHKRPFLRQKLL